MREATKIYLKQIVVTILTALSKAVLKKYKPKIIAVTGSVGKTTTKDAIFAGLAPYLNVRKSEKSFNSEIGVPLTILGCRNAWSSIFLWLQNFLKGFLLVIFNREYPEWLILEIGADRPDDIKNISKWLKVDGVVITRLPEVPVHVEFFSSPEELVKEKMYLVEAIKTEGFLVINADDQNLMETVKSINMRKITYGLKKDADVEVGDLLIEYKIENNWEEPTGITFEINSHDNKSSINLNNILSESVALACAATVAVGLEIKLNFNDVVKGLSMFIPPNGRMKLIKSIKNSLIIDDSYNSSPAALIEAIDIFKKINSRGRKIYVLGDMLELGKYSYQEHKRIGKIVAQHSDILVTVGLRSRGFVEGALEEKMSEKCIFQYENSISAGKEWQNLLKERDILLVKGSQGVRMEKFIEEIMLEPERKEELLVRQDKEWQKI